MRRYLVFAFLGFLMIVQGCAGANVGDKAAALQNRAIANIEDGTTNVYEHSGNYRLETDKVTDNAVEAEDRNTLLTSDRAKKIATAVAGLDSVKKASAVITGNRVIIGIQLAGELTDENLLKTKKEVESLVKDIDRKIEHVAVTATEDLMKRISKLANSAVSGEDEEETEQKGSDTTPHYNERLEDVVGQLTPRV